MESFFELLKNRRFLFSLIIIIIIVCWQLASGYSAVAIIFIAVLVGVIILNLVKTLK